MESQIVVVLLLLEDKLRIDVDCCSSNERDSSGDNDKVVRDGVEITKLYKWIRNLEKH